MTDEGLPNSEAQSDGEREFRPFREFAASELTFSYQQTPHGPWELRHGGDLVGIVDRRSGLVRGEGGRWRVEVARRVLGWRLILKPVEHPQPSGSYTPRHVLPGGTIALSEGGSYILRPQSLFGQAWTVSDGGGAFAFFLLLLGQAFGWPYPRGGAGRLSDALVGELERLGGQLRCACRVERIVSRRGRVDAVVGAGGEDLPCEAVVAAISASPLAAMLPDDALPDRLLRRLRGWRYGLGAFKLDWALAGPVPWSSADTRRAGVVHLGDTLAALAAAAHEAGAGRVPAAPTLVVGQHSLHDPTRAPAGQHTLYAYTHLPQQPDLSDEQIADRVEQRIESFAPGFRELVLGRSCRSPRRLERENPSMVGGDLGGGSFELDQQFVFRPAPELCRYRTPLRGLYLAGSSTHPGAGVHGVSGDGAARALLADRSALRFWR